MTVEQFRSHAAKSAAQPYTATEADGATTTTDSSVNSSLNQEVRNFLAHLHQAWSSRAPASAYAKLRDDLLLQREQVDARVAALSAVARIAYPDALDADLNWQELISLAKSIEDDGTKRKRAYREANRLRNYLVVAALWSPQLLVHYGWDKVGQTQMYALRACATQYPHFVDDVCPRLNSILLDRHRQGIKDGRTKTLNEATIQLGRDLALPTLASTTPIDVENDPWLTDESGEFPLDPGGPWLSQLRPKHFRSYLLKVDCYGVLIARDRGFDQQIRVQTSPTSQETLSVQQLRSPSSQPANLLLTTFPTSGDSMTSAEVSRTVGTDIDEPSIRTSQLLDSLIDLQFDPFMGASPDNSRTPGEIISSLSEPLSIQNDWQIYDNGPSPLQLSEFDDSDGAAWTASRDEYPLDDDVTTPDTSQTGTNISRGSRSDSTSDQSMESESDLELCSSRDIDMYDTTPETPALAVRDKSALPLDIQSVEARTGSLAHRRSAFGTLNLRRGPAKRRPGQQAKRLDSVMVSPSLFAHAGLSMEGILQTRHHNLLDDYATKVVNEARHEGASQRQKSRARWFNPDTKWASIWTQSNGGLPCGSASSADEAEVHYYTSDEFIVAAREGQIFHKPIVIKEKFMDSGMHTIDGVASQLQDATSNAVIEVRKLDDLQPASILVEDFVAGIRTKRLEGVNAPNLPHVTKCHQPLFTMLPRFRLLQSLIGRTEGRAIGKRVLPTPVDAVSCTSSSVLGFAGAFSGPHLDNLCGTWIRNLAGIKFCMIIPEEDMKSQWDKFAMSGCDWDANGKQRLLLLEQDDVLLLPPGLNIVHATLSPVHCLMEGGMLWDELNTIQTLDSIRWVCKNRAATDQPIASKLPDIIMELEEIVKEQTDRFRGRIPKITFLRMFDEAVSSLRDLECDCSQQVCDERCESRQDYRCTACCTQHP